MAGLVLVTGPTVEPITLADAKLYCKQDGDADDSLIGQLLSAARARAEHRQGMAYLTQTWDYFLDAFPTVTVANPLGQIELPLSPIQSITSIKYTKADASELTVGATTYYVDLASRPGRVVLAVNQVWPSDELRAANGVVVRFIAGYTTDALVPDASKNAIRELLLHYYEHRSVTPEIPAGIETELWEGSIRQYA